MGVLRTSIIALLRVSLLHANDPSAYTIYNLLLSRFYCYAWTSMAHAHAAGATIAHCLYLRLYLRLYYNLV